MNLQHYFLKCFSVQTVVRSKKLLLTNLLSKQGSALYSSSSSDSSDSSDEENGKPKSKKSETQIKDISFFLGKGKEGKKVKSSLLNNLEDTNEKVRESPKSDEEIGKTKETKEKMMVLLTTVNKDEGGKKLKSSLLNDLEKLKPSHLNNLEEDTSKEVRESSKSDEEIEMKEETKKKMMDLLTTISKKTYGKDEEIKLSQASEKKKIINKEKKEDIEFIDLKVKNAVKDVADLLGGDKDKTESELLHSLKSVTSSSQSLRDIVSTMKVSKPEEALHPVSRLHEFRKATLPVDRHVPQSFEKVDVFGAEPLDIFPKDFKPEGQESILSVWDSLMEREKKLSVTHHPKNYFEEMASWTEKGIAWTFPIDNEIGLEEEKSYTFADHIFLEKHLEGWCPKKGPIRHYMELVCVGLSKNPYVTVERKIAHIEWQRNYFEDKKELLKDLGVL